MISRILGTGAPAAADANLILQIAMGAALLGGAAFARMKRYTSHAICQAAVLLINAVAISWVMLPSFQYTVLPRLPKRWHHAYYLWPAVHGALGALAEIFGIYIVLAAGTNLLPAKLKFRRWKFWMRFELALWWLVLLTGVGTYL
ncbi:MAG: hypothetical protein ACRD36_07265, partial [Candidatus Acidiferrum sp.]